MATKLRWIRRSIIRFAALIALAAGLPSPAASEELFDPAPVLFDQFCRSQVIQLEVWDRRKSSWKSHPQHPLVLSGSCQLEDAGYLMNEIRTRCVRMDGRTYDGWRHGVDVYRAGIVEACVPVSLRAPRIELISPKPGEVVRNETRLARVEGRIDFEPTLTGRPRSELAALLLERERLATPTIRELRVENVSESVEALEVSFEPDGHFVAMVELREGENILRVSVRDENAREVTASVSVQFDIGALREQWRRVERARMEQIRAERRRGVITIEAMERED
jgi:hypothetical protein